MYESKEKANELSRYFYSTSIEFLLVFFVNDFSFNLKLQSYGYPYHICDSWRCLFLIQQPGELFFIVAWKCQK